MEAFFEGLNPGALFMSSWVALNSTGVLAAFEAIAYTLLLFFITSQALQAATSGRGEQLRQLMFRSLLAAGLLANVGWLQVQLVESWRGVYEWSTHTATDMIGAKGSAVKEQLEGVTESAWSMNVIGTINDVMTHTDIDQAGQGLMSGSTALGSGAITVTQLAQSNWGMNSPFLKFGLKAAARTLRLLVIPVVAMFIVLIYGSGLIVMLGGLFLPIAISLLASGAGFQAVAQAISKIIAAFATLVAIPILFMAVMDLAVYQPLIAFVDGIQHTVETWQSSRPGAEVPDPEAVASEPERRGIVETVGSWFTNGIDLGLPSKDDLLQQWNGFWTAVDNVFDAVFAGLLMAVGGVIAAFVLLMQLESYINGFLSGIATRAASAMGAQTGISKVAGATANDIQQNNRERSMRESRAREKEQSEERYARWEAIWSGEPPASNDGGEPGAGNGDGSGNEGDGAGTEDSGEPDNKS